MKLLIELNALLQSFFFPHFKKSFDIQLKMVESTMECKYICVYVCVCVREGG